MKAVAAASVGQYEQSVRALTDYVRTVELGLGACFRREQRGLGAATPNDWVDGRAIGVVVFGSDQGLVGQFNDVAADYAVDLLGKLGGTVQVWAVGDRVQARLKDAGVTPAGTFSLPNTVSAITDLVGQILDETVTRRDIRELHLVYNRRTEGAGYAPISERLLPLDVRWSHELAQQPWPTKQLPEVIGTGTSTLSALIREYLFVSLFRASAQSLASENASRLAAMTRADKSIADLLESLQGTLHRLRQSAIDEELFDVVAGFEALTTPPG